MVNSHYRSFFQFFVKISHQRHLWLIFLIVSLKQCNGQGKTVPPRPVPPVPTTRPPVSTDNPLTAPIAPQIPYQVPRDVGVDRPNKPNYAPCHICANGAGARDTANLISASGGPGLGYLRYDHRIIGPAIIFSRYAVVFSKHFHPTRSPSYIVCVSSSAPVCRAVTHFHFAVGYYLLGYENIGPFGAIVFTLSTTVHKMQVSVKDGEVTYEKYTNKPKNINESFYIEESRLYAIIDGRDTPVLLLERINPGLYALPPKMSIDYGIGQITHGFLQINYIVNGSSIQPERCYPLSFTPSYDAEPFCYYSGDPHQGLYNNQDGKIAFDEQGFWMDCAPGANRVLTMPIFAFDGVVARLRSCPTLQIREPLFVRSRDFAVNSTINELDDLQLSTYYDTSFASFASFEQLFNVSERKIVGTHFKPVEETVDVVTFEVVGRDCKKFMQPSVLISNIAVVEGQLVECLEYDLSRIVTHRVKVNLTLNGLFNDQGHYFGLRPGYYISEVSEKACRSIKYECIGRHDGKVVVTVVMNRYQLLCNSEIFSWTGSKAIYGYSDRRYYGYEIKPYREAFACRGKVTKLPDGTFESDLLATHGPCNKTHKHGCSYSYVRTEQSFHGIPEGFSDYAVHDDGNHTSHYTSAVHDPCAQVFGTITYFACRSWWLVMIICMLFMLIMILPMRMYYVFRKRRILLIKFAVKLALFGYKKVAAHLYNRNKDLLEKFALVTNMSDLDALEAELPDIPEIPVAVWTKYRAEVEKEINDIIAATEKKAKAAAAGQTDLRKRFSALRLKQIANVTSTLLFLMTCLTCPEYTESIKFNAKTIYSTPEKHAEFLARRKLDLSETKGDTHSDQITTFSFQLPVGSVPHTVTTANQNCEGDTCTCSIEASFSTLNLVPGSVIQMRADCKSPIITTIYLSTIHAKYDVDYLYSTEDYHWDQQQTAACSGSCPAMDCLSRIKADADRPTYFLHKANIAQGTLLTCCWGFGTGYFLAGAQYVSNGNRVAHIFRLKFSEFNAIYCVRDNSKTHCFDSEHSERVKLVVGQSDIPTTLDVAVYIENDKIYKLLVGSFASPRSPSWGQVGEIQFVGFHKDGKPRTPYIWPNTPGINFGTYTSRGCFWPDADASYTHFVSGITYRQPSINQLHAGYGFNLAQNNTNGLRLRKARLDYADGIPKLDIGFEYFSGHATTVVTYSDSVTVHLSELWKKSVSSVDVRDCKIALGDTLNNICVFRVNWIKHDVSFAIRLDAHDSLIVKSSEHIILNGHDTDYPFRVNTFGQPTTISFDVYVGDVKVATVASSKVAYSKPKAFSAAPMTLDTKVAFSANIVENRKNSFYSVFVVVCICILSTIFLFFSYRSVEAFRNAGAGAFKKPDPEKVV